MDLVHENKLVKCPFFNPPTADLLANDWYRIHLHSGYNLISFIK